MRYNFDFSPSYFLFSIPISIQIQTHFKLDVLSFFLLLYSLITLSFQFECLRNKVEQNTNTNVDQLANFNKFIDEVFKFMPKKKEEKEIDLITFSSKNSTASEIRGNSLASNSDDYTDTEDEEDESSETNWSDTATCGGRNIYVGRGNYKQKLHRKKY